MAIKCMYKKHETGLYITILKRKKEIIVVEDLEECKALKDPGQTENSNRQIIYPRKAVYFLKLIITIS